MLMSEKQARLQLGNTADVTLRSMPDRAFRGKVVRIRRESDRVTEQLTVDISFDEPPDTSDSRAAGGSDHPAQPREKQLPCHWPRWCSRLTERARGRLWMAACDSSARGWVRSILPGGLKSCRDSPSAIKWSSLRENWLISRTRGAACHRYRERQT